MEYATMRRTLLRVGAVLAAAGVAVFAFTTPAAAHVSVSSTDATQGGYAKVTFRVPNEKDTATTVKVEVVLPADQPIVSVSVKPLTGWTATTETTKLATPVKNDDGEEVTEAVSKITWTATGGAAIQAGQFQEFDVSMGPLPKTDQVVFKALQTYSDGDIVRWIEVAAAGAAEPEHPAPTLKLAKAGGDTVEAANTTNTSNTAATDTSSSGSGAGTALGIVGIVLGLAGLVIGLLAYRKAAARIA
jgi:uncharacterized protein YcnI